MTYPLAKKLGMLTGHIARTLGSMTDLPLPNTDSAQLNERATPKNWATVKKLPLLARNPLVSAALSATAELGDRLLSQSNVRLSINNTKARLFHLNHEDQFPLGIKEVDDNVEAIRTILLRKDVRLERLGISGIPGSGKSTLAHALAERLGMRWLSLDHENLNLPMDLTKPATIYEHHRLFQTQEVDLFDAILYVDRPIAEAKANIIKRTRAGRSGIIVDTFDFTKLRKISKLAFDACEGESQIIPGSPVILKSRPPQGYRARENLIAMLPKPRRDEHALFTQMKKEELVFLAAYGKSRYGLLAYFLPGGFNKELLKAMEAGIDKLLFYWRRDNTH